MSTHGFQALNAAGNVIADDTYPCYAILDEGSVTIGGTQMFTQAYISFSKPIAVTSNPIVGVQLSADAYGSIYCPVTFHSFNVSGDYIYGARILSSFVTGVYRTVSYIVAAPAQDVTPLYNDYGIAVYDAASQLTFHSGQKLVTLAAAITTTPTLAAQTLSHPAMDISNRYVFIGNNMSSRASFLVDIQYDAYGNPHYYSTLAVPALIYEPTAPTTAVRLVWNDATPEVQFLMAPGQLSAYPLTVLIMQKSI